MTKSKFELVRDLMEHILVTPEFSGTDEEKIAVLQYWADLVRQVRGINSAIASHDNKIRVLDQIQKELELMQLEITNATSQPVQTADGATTLVKIPDEQQPEDVVDLSVSPPADYPPSSPFSPHRPLTTEDLNRISRGPTTEDLKKMAGIMPDTKPATPKPIRETPNPFQLKTIDAAGLQKMAGIHK